MLPEKGTIVLYQGEKYRVTYAGPTRRGPRICIMDQNGAEQWCSPEDIQPSVDQRTNIPLAPSPAVRAERRPFTPSSPTSTGETMAAPKMNGHEGGNAAQLALCVATLRDMSMRLERLENICLGIAEKLEVV